MFIIYFIIIIIIIGEVYMKWDGWMLAKFPFFHVYGLRRSWHPQIHTTHTQKKNNADNQPSGLNRLGQQRFYYMASVKDIFHAGQST